ncbi:MAG: hypothetical protein ACRCU0_02290 [Candidatus Rhabdochlamydia sp.]
MDRARNNNRNNLSSILAKIYRNIPVIIAAILWISPLKGIANDDVGAIYTRSIEDKDPLIQRIYGLVIKSIDHLEDLPGIKDVPKIAKSVHVLKLDLKTLWTQLVEEGFAIIEETDKVGRPYAVYLQAIIEDVLSSELQKGQLKSLEGVIHTPMPATPLCTEGKISKDLIVATIEKDFLRLGTVLCRSIIVREYLKKGGKLEIVYPKYGKPRTVEQLKIYQETLKKYAPYLKDHPLDCISIHKDLNGAYYTFKNLEGKKFAFAISASQANDVLERNIFGLCFNLQEKSVFGLWFDEFDHHPVHERISEVEEFIKERDFPPFYKHKIRYYEGFR